MITVFASSAATGITTALRDREPGSDVTAEQFMGVGAGVYAGGVATKVATGSIKFAYGVQGAAIGAMMSKVSVMVWKPKLLWLVPELEKSEKLMNWLDLTVASAMGGLGMWVANAFKAIISVVATAVIGTLGFVGVAAGYGIPGVENFTLENLATNGLNCEDDDCWTALGGVIVMAIGGTVNQMKMAEIDITMPASSTYERYLQLIESKMALIFKMAEFIENSADMDMEDLMEECMEARERFSKYINIGSNAMQFGLCFGFVADWITEFMAGVYNAVPCASAARFVGITHSIRTLRGSYHSICIFQGRAYFAVYWRS
jgi:hypothetical protein